MLTGLLALLSSSAVGSIIGLFGGLLNRKIDLQAKRMDQEHEIKKLQEQGKFLEIESKTKIAVATEEKEGAIESAAYNALAASYSFAVPTKDDGIVDKISKIIRPFLTIAFFILTAYIFYQIHTLVQKAGILDSKELFDIYKQIIEWIFFQAGVSIGWWFAMRPGKTPKFHKG